MAAARAGRSASDAARRSGRADPGPGRLAGAQQAGRPARRDAGAGAAYRLEVELDDNITGFGIRGDRAVTRERRTLRARYRLVDLADRRAWCSTRPPGPTPASTSSAREYATVAAEQTALERLSEVVADQIVARLGLFATRTRARRDEGRQGAASAARSTSPTGTSASICSTAPTKPSRARLASGCSRASAPRSSSSSAARSRRTRRCSPTKPAR